jgi:2,4-dienoyl-CoA reductase-like NADH-dependent reductase (Old Yellow Enzyme family)
MCQYSATDGVPQDWHLVHLGQFALSGPGLILTEATGVEPQGRITLGCTGLYNDATEQAFSRIINFIKSVSDIAVGIQLGHAGRKGSTVEPWKGGGMIEGKGAWHPQAPLWMRHIMLIGQGLIPFRFIWRTDIYCISFYHQSPIDAVISMVETSTHACAIR